MSSITDTLLKAYQETKYHVYADPAFTLHPDTFCPELVQIHKRYHASSSAVITAWNPYSKMLTKKANAQRQKLLTEKVSNMGLRSIGALGQHPSGHWPGEESLFIVDIKLVEATGLGKLFEQNAIIFAAADARPTITLLE